MSETADADAMRVPRRRIAIGSDGSVTGDDAADHLGAALRYACRMAGQIEPLLDLGPLQWLTTVSGTSVTARVGRSAGDFTVTAEVEERQARAPLPMSVDAGGAHVAIKKCLHRVRDDLEAEWCAVITSDNRVVGALLPDAGRATTDVRAVLAEVGLRALAVLGSLDESYRETAVVLEYAGGSLMLAAVEGDVLFAAADKFDTAIAARLIDEVRSVLAPHDLDLVWTWGESWAEQ